MKKKRIVVTGMGIVSAFGNDIDLFYKKLLDGNSCVTTITEFNVDDYPTKIGSC